jgi:hypothetical protein
MTGGLANHHYTVTWLPSYKRTRKWDEAMLFAQTAAQDTLL